jgi:hypothetical protein
VVTFVTWVGGSGRVLSPFRGSFRFASLAPACVRGAAFYRRFAAGLAGRDDWFSFSNFDAAQAGSGFSRRAASRPSAKPSSLRSTGQPRAVPTWGVVNREITPLESCYTGNLSAHPSRLLPCLRGQDARAILPRRYPYSCADDDLQSGSWHFLQLGCGGCGGRRRCGIW